MTSPPAKPPTPAEERTARLAAALRANLKRRKAQARAREAGAAAEPDPQAPKVAPPRSLG